MAAGQIIGRVAVKVLPDTDDFRRDAQKRLDAIEKQLSVTISTKIDMSGANTAFLKELREINQRNRNEDARKIRFATTIASGGMREEIAKAVRRLQVLADAHRVKINLDLVAATAVLEINQDSLDDVRKALEDFRKQNSPLKVMVHPEMVIGSTTVIEKRLEYLSRPRSVPFLPHVNEGAAARVAAVLNALAGSRVVVNYLRDIAQWLGKLDTLVPVIGSLAMAMAGLAGWALSAASNLFALSVSLAQIGPAALLIPGLLGGMAIGAGITAAALRDFNQVIPEVKTQLATLQDALSANFWAVAEAPIRNLIDNLFPQLSAGMQLASTQIGGYFAALATALSGAFDGALIGMFADLSASIAIATTGTAALAGIMRTLGEVGAGYLPQLAQWFVDITTRFDAFLSAAAADGRLATWIDTALQQLAALGGVVSGVAQILAGIGTAAVNAGGASLSTMADTLQRVADIVEGPAFQTILTGVFVAAHGAMSQIATISGPAVADLFTTLAGTLTTILPMVGQTIGALLNGVASALAQPEFQAGLTNLFTGLQSGFNALLPALGPVALALGALGGVLGTFATVLGPIIGVVFTTLAGVLQSLLPAIQPLIAVLGGALMGIFQTLSPIILSVATALGSLVSGGLVTTLQAVLTPLLGLLAQLGPAVGTVLVTAIGLLEPVLAALAPILGDVFGQLGTFLGTALPQLVPVLSLLGKTLGENIGGVLKVIGPLIGTILGALIQILTPLFDAIMKIVSTALPPLLEVFQRLIPVLTPIVEVLGVVIGFLADLLAPAIAFVADIIANVLIAVLEGLVQVFSGVIDTIMGIWNFFAGLFTGDWDRMWSGIGQIFSGLWDVIVGLFNTILNTYIRGLIDEFTVWIVGIWKSTWNSVLDTIRSVIAWIWSAIQAWLADLVAAPGRTMALLESLFDRAWNAIADTVSAAWQAVLRWVRDGIDNVVSNVKALPDKAKAAIGNIGDTLINAGKSLIEGFINGIKNMFGSVQNTLSDLTDKLTDWKGPESLDRVLLVGAGQLIIDGLITGLESRYGAVRKSLAGLTADIGGTDFAAPTISGVKASQVSAKLAGALSGAGDNGTGNKILNYYAAEGSSIDSEEDLFAAANRARMVW